MRIVQLIPDFRLGGVQKAGCLLAEYLARRSHETWVFGRDCGPRYVENGGSTGAQHRIVREDQLLDQLVELRPDIIHVHAGRYEDAGLEPLLASSRLKSFVKVVTPVFARPPSDRRLLRQVKTCCVGLYTYYRLLRWLSYSAAQACEQGIIYAPLTPFQPPLSDFSATQPAEVIAERRQRLGLAPASFVIGRIGRNAPRKWHNNMPNLVDKLLEQFPDVAWLSIGMPNEHGGEQLRKKWHARFANLPETADYERICEILSCLDLQLFMSVWGECFASSICEPAGLGVPTLAVSTPLNDNGQTEQVLDGTTGFLLGSVGDAAVHIDRLRKNPTELGRLKRTTRDYAHLNWHAEVVAARLEQVYSHWLGGADDAGPLSEEIVANHQTFAAGYRRRVVGLATNNPFSYTLFYTALAAAECYPAFRIGRRFKRWRPST